MMRALSKLILLTCAIHCLSVPVQLKRAQKVIADPLILSPEVEEFSLPLPRMKYPNTNEQLYGDSEEYDEEDDDDDDKEMVVIRKKPDKFEKFEAIGEKIYSKFLDKYLHIKSDKPPDPPKWATDMNLNLFGPAPDIELPPWHTLLNNNQNKKAQ